MNERVQMLLILRTSRSAVVTPCSGTRLFSHRLGNRLPCLVFNIAVVFLQCALILLELMADMRQGRFPFPVTYACEERAVFGRRKAQLCYVTDFSDRVRMTDELA
jgi:hypothetical protein